MKKHIWILLFAITLGFNVSNAQTTDADWNLILVREDVVKPSMIANYELSLLKITEFLAREKITDVNYVTEVQDNYHYSHVSILKSLDDFKGGLQAYISGEKASDEFKLIWDELNACLISHRLYVVRYDAEYSHVTDGKVWLEEAPFRKWNYYYFSPGSEKEVDELLSAWKNLYIQQGIENGYRVFRGVIGIDQPVIIFTSWAKSPLELQQIIQKNNAVLGERGAELWISMLELSRKIETIEGWYLPFYSYQPE